MLNVVHQISRALQFYSSSAEFSNIRTIYLPGSMASIKGLAEVVEQELGIKTSVADPISGLEIVAVGGSCRPEKECAQSDDCHGTGTKGV